MLKLTTQSIANAALDIWKVESRQFVFNKLIELKEGESYGFVSALGNAVVTHRGDYMELDSEEGIKKTNCVDAANYLVGQISFAEVREQ